MSLELISRLWDEGKLQQAAVEAIMMISKDLKTFVHEMCLWSFNDLTYFLFYKQQQQ